MLNINLEQEDPVIKYSPLTCAVQGNSSSPLRAPITNPQYKNIYQPNNLKTNVVSSIITVILAFGPPSQGCRQLLLFNRNPLERQCPNY